MSGIPWFAACLLIAIAWGALSFGAVYPWAYWPLAAAAALIGIRGLLWRRDIDARPLPGSVLMALAVTLVAMAVQLIPFQRDVVTTLSPNTMRVVENYDLLSATAGQTRHTLSIEPRATL